MRFVGLYYMKNIDEWVFFLYPKIVRHRERENETQSAGYFWRDN